MLQSVLVGLAAVAIGAHYTGHWTLPTRLAPKDTAADETERFSCRPFLPKLFADTPPAPDSAHIRAAAAAADAHFTARFAKGDIDALSIAVLTSEGPVFEKNWGVNRGNETASSPPATSHSSYRIASVSKLMLVYEAFLLQEKGVLSWEDPVEKYIPNFKYRAEAFSPTPLHQDLPQSKAPITIFQLAAHTSGLGRDWPSGNVKGWPHDMTGSPASGGPPPTNGLPFPSHDALFKSIERLRLISPPNAYPAYSNTGTGLLGLVLVAANKAKYGKNEPDTYAELMQRDIFGPLGMNGSHFLTTNENKHLVVAPSLAPEVADQDFLDAMNPAGGQFSSLSDCIKFTQVLLNAHRPDSLISQYSLDRWLKPVHVFEEDDWTEIGLIWEILKHRDSNGRLRRIYWKLGAMAGYHAAIALHPGTSYAVVVLLGGRYPDAARLAYDAFDIFQPVFDKSLAELASSLYVGTWGSGNDTATISLERGTLYIERLVLEGRDILKNFFAPGRLALRSTERRDELRIDTGIPGYNGVIHMGCYPYWNGQDLWGLKNDAPVNLLYFTTGKDGKRTLHVPATQSALERLSA
ncbi:beta-lactamase/transpeptidase-like protein [Auricularia subglabra TFB-10046 SS5]|nr:beta-lactamase/transpeptidase-like protein [Auricularia subglabra TFB-10046 SS5]